MFRHHSSPNHWSSTCLPTGLSAFLTILHSPSLSPPRAMFRHLCDCQGTWENMEPLGQIHSWTLSAGSLTYILLISSLGSHGFKGLECTRCWSMASAQVAPLPGCSLHPTHCAPPHTQCHLPREALLAPSTADPSQLFPSVSHYMCLLTCLFSVSSIRRPNSMTAMASMFETNKLKIIMSDSKKCHENGKAG